MRVEQERATWNRETRLSGLLSLLLYLMDQRTRPCSPAHRAILEKLWEGG